MVQTITPVVHGGRRSWRRSVALHAAGALVSAAALGAVLGGVGLALGAPWGRNGLIVVATVAIAYAAREAVGLPVPIPELRRQVPEWWRSSFPPGVTSFLYGLGLGVGFATHLRHGTLVAVAAAALASGDPLLGMLTIAPFGLARAGTVVLAHGATTSGAVAAITDRLERWARRPIERVTNTVALIAVAIVAGAMASRDGGGGTSGLASILLAVVFAWAAVTKLAAFAPWRRSLVAYDLPVATATVVPLLEAGTAAALLANPRIGAWAALVLLVLFSFALLRARTISGDRLPCGCFGGEKKRDVRLMLWRNAALAAIAALILAEREGSVPALGVPRGMEALPALLAALGAALAVAAFRQVRSLLRPSVEDHL